MPTFKVWMLRQRAQKLDATTKYWFVYDAYDVKCERR
jgi:hypothetical protein